MHTEIQGCLQEFKKKVTKIGSNVIKINNVKEEVRSRIEQFQTTLN